MEQRDLYTKKIEAQLDALNARMDLLKAQAVNAKLDAQDEFQKKLDELTHQKSEFVEKLDELKSQGSETWQDLTDDLEETRQSIEHDVQEALKEFA